MLTNVSHDKWKSLNFIIKLFFLAGVDSTDFEDYLS